MWFSTRPTSKWHFVLGLPKLGLSQFWGPVTLCVGFWSKWILKQSCYPCWELFNGTLHATCSQGNRIDSSLLVIGNQIANLTPDLSFGQNLCFKCSNGSCELNLDIYVSISFQWYKKLFNPMGFDPYNRPLNIQESIGTLNFQNGNSLGSVRVPFLTLSYTPGSMRGDYRVSLLARNLASPCFGCEPKVRVATFKTSS
jgi:hypothetical protein